MGKTEYAIWSILNATSVWHIESLNNMIYLDIPSSDMEVSLFVYNAIYSALKSDGKSTYDISETTYPDHISIHIIGKKANHLYNSIVKYDQKSHK